MKPHNKKRTGKNIPKQDSIQPIPKDSLTGTQLVVAFSEETQAMRMKDGRYSNYVIKQIIKGDHVYPNGISFSPGDHIILDSSANIKENDLVVFALQPEFLAVDGRIGTFKKVEGENIIIEMPFINGRINEPKSKFIYLQKIFGKVVIQKC